jgi:hypothetical protein
MIDIPKLLEEKAKQRTQDYLQQIMLHLATNSRFMEESEYKQFINGLTKGLGEPVSQEFSREKFEELRMLTNMGANRR